MDKNKFLNSVKGIINQVIKENLTSFEDETNESAVQLHVKDGLKSLFREIKGEYGISFNEFANIAVAHLAKYTNDRMNENQPAPSQPTPSPGPMIAPGKPGEKEGPRRPFIKPNVKPKPKAQVTEAEILSKIIKRYKNGKI